MYRRCFFAFLALLLTLSFVAAADFELGESLRGRLVVKWHMDKYQITPYGDGYVLVGFPGGSGTLGDGKPQLPSQQVFVEIPRGVTPQLRIIDAVTESVQLSRQVYPSQPCPTDTVGERNKKREFVKDLDAYAATEPFPGVVAHVVRTGIMRGRKIALLRVNPFQYVPKTGEMKVYKELSLEITYPQGRREIAASDDAMDDIARGLVLNFQPGTAKYRGLDYLIITHDDYIAKVNEYAQWKREQGYDTKVVKLGDITDLRAASAGAVKAEIKKYYPGLKYLLFVADANQIPLPTSIAKSPLDGTNLRANSTPSDLCYALLEGDDYYPDLYIGRIPAGNAQEAEVMIDKLLGYEKNPDTGDWYKRFLLCGEFQYQYSQTNRAERLFCETAYVIHRSLKGLYDFPADTIGSGSSGLGHDEYFFRAETYRHKIKDSQGMNCRMPAEWAANIKSTDEAKANTLAFWRKGAFLVQHRDHGGETVWGKPNLNRTDVSKLDNGRKLPVLFSINCLTGAIDYSSGDCFVEAALKNPQGGAVAALAASRVSYSWWNDTLCDGFYTCLFGESVYDSMRQSANPAPGQPSHSAALGVILNYGKMYLTVNYPDNPWNSNREEIEFYLFHCYGPPDMMIRTQKPTQLAVTCATRDGNMEVTVKDRGGKVVQDAKVCFYADGIVHVATTGERGVVSTPAVKGKVKVTVTGHNLYPHQEIVEIK